MSLISPPSNDLDNVAGHNQAVSDIGNGRAKG